MRRTTGSTPGRGSAGGYRYSVFVLIFTRIIKSAVTGQAPESLEWKDIPEKEQSKSKEVYVYDITAEAIHASA